AWFPANNISNGLRKCVLCINQQSSCDHGIGWNYDGLLPYGTHLSVRLQRVDRLGGIAGVGLHEHALAVPDEADRPRQTAIQSHFESAIYPPCKPFCKCLLRGTAAPNFR